MKSKGPLVTVFAGVACLVVVLLIVTSAGKLWRKDSTRAARPPLGGTWILKLPAGFTHTVQLEQVGDDRYELDRLVFAGVYELREDRLVMVKPRDPRLTEFVWRTEPGGSLVLVEEPAVSKTGASYRGATLTREPELR